MQKMMKEGKPDMKRRCIVLLFEVLLMILLPVAGIPEGTGLIVTVASDKSVYEADDIAKITLGIENRTGKTVRDIHIAHYLQSGQQYAGNGISDMPVIAELRDGEKTQISFRIKRETPKIAVRVISDKNKYQLSDTAKLTVTIDNLGDKPIRNVNIRHLLPEGLIYAAGTHGQNDIIDEIRGKENKTVEFYVKRAERPPETGDDSVDRLIGAMISLAAAFAMMMLLRRGRGVQEYE